MKALKGVFTPEAGVLCYSCSDISDMELKMVVYPVNEPIELIKGYEYTTCDKCSTVIQVGDWLAAEHILTGLLRQRGIDANLWQTGGMNHCVGIKARHLDNSFIISYHDRYGVGYYDEEGNPLIGYTELGDLILLKNWIEKYEHLMEMIDNTEGR